MKTPKSAPPYVMQLQRDWRRANPIARLREELGMPRAMFGLWLGVNAGTLRLVEQGYYAKLPARLVRALDEAGLDGEERAREYVAWRAGFQAALQTAMRSVSQPSSGADKENGNDNGSRPRHHTPGATLIRLPSLGRR